MRIDYRSLFPVDGRKTGLQWSVMIDRRMIWIGFGWNMMDRRCSGCVCGLMFVALWTQLSFSQLLVGLATQENGLQAQTEIM